MDLPRQQHGTATLYLGDCLDVIPTLDQVDTVLADPPYSSGGVFRGDRAQKVETKYCKDNGLPGFEGDARDQRGFLAWSRMWMAAARKITRPGGLILVFSDWRQVPITSDALQTAGWVWRGIAVWDKTEACRPQLGRYRNQAEYLLWGTNGGRPTEGKTAPGVFQARVNPAEKKHITYKPVGLLMQALKLAGETVLDPFMGSGTAGIATLKTGRRYIGIELDPHWYAVACDLIKAEAARRSLFD